MKKKQETKQTARTFRPKQHPRQQTRSTRYTVLPDETEYPGDVEAMVLLPI